MRSEVTAAAWKLYWAKINKDTMAERVKILKAYLH
jgi:hypothetical protein